ncbi:MAG: ABC transporter substrate-binding protein [Nitrososphaerales archaeon]|nr:ABC transporter substrate-binding protein [Nitrososphaerales archaeon]
MKTRSLQRRYAIGRGITAVIIIIILVIVGAGAYFVLTPSTATTTSPTSSTPTSSTTTPPTLASGTLSVSFANVPVTDPAKGSDEASSTALVNLYDSLVFPTSAGTLQPDLATSWQVSSDGLTYTFKMRQGVTFHNGDPVTASDVVFSMNRLITVGQGYSYLFSPYIGNVTALDSSTVAIHLKKTFGPFLTALVRLYILDQKQVVANIGSGPYGSNGDYGSTWLLTHDAGSGPYSIQAANLESFMTLQAYTNYWNGTQTNQPSTVQIIGSTSSTQALFSSKQIQITDQWQPYSTVASLAQLKGAKLVTIPTVNEFYLMINTKQAPTDDIFVREAMTYAFNYTAVVNDIFTGSKPSAGPVPSALPGHDSAIPVGQQNLALAKQLMAKSKYAGQLNNYPVKYFWVTQVPAEQKMALQFASDMQQIGITVQVIGQPWLTVVADLANLTSSPNIVSIQDGASYFEAGSVLQSRYTSASDGTWEQNEWLQNTTLDNMIYSALSTLDQTARFKAYATIQQQIYNMYPTICAFDVYEVRAYYPTVVNWYAANGHPIVLLGYDFYFRDFQFYPSQLAALG